MTSSLQYILPFRITAALFLVAMFNTVCDAIEVPPSWKVECVGRFQINLPGEVEVALVKSETFPRVPAVSPYVYSDNTRASYSQTHSEGIIYVSTPLRTKDVKKIVIDHQKIIDDAIREYVAEGEKQKAKSLQRLRSPGPDSYAWMFGNGLELYMHRDDRLFTWAGPNHKTIEHNDKLMLEMLNGFRTRRLYDVPEREGVCIPYGFIPDDGKGWRNVGVSFRLKDHPDVEIFFRDEGARELPYRLVNRSTREELQFFWEHNYRGAMKEVHLSWPHYRSVKLDGRDGEYTFARFTRTDGTPDFGYLAYVKGDAKAASDTPSLMLYVIRTGSRAKGSPVSEDELKDIAKKVAASIRRRA